MKRAAIAASLCLGLQPSAANAFVWSLRTSQIETIELNDNLFLRSSPAPSLGSYSTLTANAEARTPRSSFKVDADGNYRKLWGPGIEGAPSESLSHGVTARYEQRGKFGTDREFVETTFRQSSAAFALLGDLGVVTNARGFLNRLSYSGGVDRSLTARDTVSLFATSTQISYDPAGGGVPVTNTSARGSWQHRLTPVISANLVSEAEFIAYENASDSRVQIYRNQVGANATLSPVLSFRANVGAAYLAVEGGIDPFASIPNNISSPAASSTLLDWIGDAVLTYRALKNTTLALNASQSIGPSLVGSLFKRNTIFASLNHTVNSKTNLAFNAGFNRSVSTTSSDFFTGSVTYSYRVSTSLFAALTYRYVHRFAGSGGGSVIDPLTLTPTVSGIGAASSNSIMLVVSNNYTILPSGY